MPLGGIIAIAASLTMMTALGAGISLGNACSKASESVARNPEAASKILSTSLIFATLSEVTAIFAFVIAVMLVGKI